MKTQKCLIAIIFLIGCMATYAQEFKNRHIRKLENLGIPFKTEYSASEQATKDLHQILHYDFKRRAKNTVGATLLTIGVGGMIGGVVLSKEAKYDRHGFTQIAAGTSILIGIGGIGTSIPFFTGSRQTRKERDQLKMLYQSETAYNTLALLHTNKFL